MSRRSIFLLIAIAVLAAASWYAWRLADPGRDLPVPRAGQVVTKPRPAPAGGDAVARGFSTLQGASGADQAREPLLELQAALKSMPQAEAVAMIREFLASGEDRATGLSFEISKDGSLAQWSTFRVFLLDTLLAIDPAAAAAVGREILATPTSADEWALALRNVARGEPLDESATFLIRKTEELITNPAWQAEPSVGYLNAFDVLVHAGATGSTPLLSELVQRKDRKDLAHAGFLTIDRLVQRQPVEMLSQIAADPSLRQSRPEMVAQQFARADLRDPAQNGIVRAWLLDPARTATELRSFAGVYPNNNRFVSNNLLTTESAQPGENLAAHDREVLQIVSGWAADAAFAPIKDYLELMISRLEGFVNTSPQTTE